MDDLRDAAVANNYVLDEQPLPATRETVLAYIGAQLETADEKNAAHYMDCDLDRVLVYIEEAAENGI